MEYRKVHIRLESPLFKGLDTVRNASNLSMNTLITMAISDFLKKAHDSKLGKVSIERVVEGFGQVQSDITINKGE